MTFRTALLAAAALAALTPLGAEAQTLAGLYVGGAAGVNLRLPATAILRGRDAETGTAFTGHAKAVSNPGLVGLGSIGWGFGNGLRAEIEGDYRANRLRRYRLGEAYPHVGGELRTYGAMVNLLFDLNLGLPVVPYLGVGAGMGWSDWGGARATGGNLGDSVRFPHAARGSIAYQGILGLSYALDQVVPGLALTAEARYYGTGVSKVHANTTINSENEHGGITSTRTSLGLKYSNHNASALIGLRYAFNSTPAPMPVPAPAQPVAPAPAPARTYIVFFDFNSADLNARSRDIVTDAVRAIRTTGTTRIEVAGHADRSGAPAYNQRLSLRRAEAVAAELGRQGVPRSQIGIEAFGESRPLVPTADNVREPQNRRVEIVLR